MFKAIVYFFCFLHFSGFATTTLMIDRYFSPESGAYNSLALFQGAKQIPVPQKKGFQPCFKRALLYFFVYSPLSELVLTTQHEIFGHGWRIRTLGSHVAKVHSYSIHPPFPYYKGAFEPWAQKDLDDFTQFSVNPELFTPSMALSVAIAGIESTNTLARFLKMQWLDEGKIDGRESILYLLSALGLSEYADSSDDNFFEDGNDLHEYIATLNTLYPSASLSMSNIRHAANLSYLDPMLFFSYYAFFRHLITGKTTHIPTLRIKSLRLLPNIRTGLTPFGMEYFLETFFSTNKLWSYFYLKFGSHGNNRYYGLGFDRIPIWSSKKNMLHLRLDLWAQPPLLLKPKDKPHSHNQAGGALFLTYSRKITQGTLMLQIGGKSAGFLPSEILKGSVFARQSLLFQF